MLPKLPSLLSSLLQQIPDLKHVFLVINNNSLCLPDLASEASGCIPFETKLLLLVKCFTKFRSKRTRRHNSIMIPKLTKRIAIRIKARGKPIRHSLQLRVIQVIGTRSTNIKAAEHRIPSLPRLNLLVIQVVLALLVHD